jgi:hypothetical protein
MGLTMFRSLCFRRDATPPMLPAAFSEDGFIASASPGNVQLTEGFAAAWKYRNVALALANAVPGPHPYPYIFGDTNYPPDAAQNVPSVFYNDAEDSSGRTTV